MSPDQIVENERRTAKPAVIAAFVAAAFLIAGSFVGFGVDKNASGEGELLRDYASSSGTALLEATLQAVGFLALIVPIYYLFIAAADRNPRVGRALRGLIVIGLTLVATAGVLASVSLSSAADEFIETVPDLEVKVGKKAIDNLVETANSQPDDLEKVRLYPASESNPGSDEGSAQAAVGDDDMVQGGGTEPMPEEGSGILEIEPTEDDVFIIPVTADRLDSVRQQLDAADLDFEFEEDGHSGDLYASTIRLDKTLAPLSLVLVGRLLSLFSIFYTALWAMRSGLLTRFWGTLAMALAVLFGLGSAAAIPGLALFSGYLGRLFADTLNGPRPPAWDTGEAIPWLRPADTSQDGSDGDEVGLPEGYGEEGAQEAPDHELRSMTSSADEPAGDAAGASKRKRKRKSR